MKGFVIDSATATADSVHGGSTYEACKCTDNNSHFRLKEVTRACDHCMQPFVFKQHLTSTGTSGDLQPKEQLCNHWQIPGSYLATVLTMAYKFKVPSAEYAEAALSMASAHMHMGAERTT